MVAGFRQTLLISICLIFFGFRPVDGPNQIAGVWLNQQGNCRVEIVKHLDSVTSETTFTGSIVWLKNPQVDQKPKTDTNNPDEKLRNRALLGLQVLSGLRYDEESGEWSSGKWYHPETGKTYSCFVKVEKGKLKIRGYTGISAIGKSETWTRNTR